MTKKNTAILFDEDKKNSFSEWYNKILVCADIIDKTYPVKGMPVYKKDGYFIHSQIMKMIEHKWNKSGHVQVQFPLLIPKTLLDSEKEHMDGFHCEVFWVTKSSEKILDVPLALRPTSETAMYPIFKEWIRSYNDLPLKVHQTCCIYRCETKSTLPLIRGREVPWNEAHTCHRTKDDALVCLEDAWKYYLELFDEIGINGVKLTRPEWDKFAGGEHTEVMDAVLPSGKLLQIVGAHYLGQKFSKAFDIKFLDDDNNTKNPYMTCYGISMRVMATCISSHGDNLGLILPSIVAPVQVVIVPIITKNKEKQLSIKNYVDEIVNVLKSDNIRVIVDTSNKRPGEKYYYWEMKGVPLRFEIGFRESQNKMITVKQRAYPDKTNINMNCDSDIIGFTRRLLKTNDNSIKKASSEQFNLSVSIASSVQEVVDIINEKGGFVKVPFYTFGIEGKTENDIINSAVGAEIRGFVLSEKVPDNEVCIFTGKPAVTYAYIGKAY